MSREYLIILLNFWVFFPILLEGFCQLMSLPEGLWLTWHKPSFARTFSLNAPSVGKQVQTQLGESLHSINAKYIQEHSISRHPLLWVTSETLHQHSCAVAKALRHSVTHKLLFLVIVSNPFHDVPWGQRSDWLLDISHVNLFLDCLFIVPSSIPFFDIL